jgi:hypothetical protein
MDELKPLRSEISGRTELLTLLYVEGNRQFNTTAELAFFKDLFIIVLCTSIILSCVKSRSVGTSGLFKPSLRYDYPLIPPNLASRPIRDEERLCNVH